MNTNVDQLPIHEHDCDHCIFLGVFINHDLYYHKGKEGYSRGSVIARYGSLGDYYSGLFFGYYDRNDLNSPIGEAFRRAVELGYVDVEKMLNEENV